jgi:hypothetical protein
MSVDEGMTAWKDWFIFKVYMSAKPHRYGIKDYLICESQSGYICNMEVCTWMSHSVKNLVFRTSEYTAAQ